MTIFKISRLMIVILSLSLLSVAPPAHADNWKEATKAYAQQKYAAAMKLFRPLAEKGHAAAQYQVALMHKMGLGVPKSEKEARKWSRLAAKQGQYPGPAPARQPLLHKGRQRVARIGQGLHVVRSGGGPRRSRSKKGSRHHRQGADPQQLADAQAKAQQCKASNYEKCDGD